MVASVLPRLSQVSSSKNESIVLPEILEAATAYTACIWQCFSTCVMFLGLPCWVCACMCVWNLKKTKNLAFNSNSFKLYMTNSKLFYTYFSDLCNSCFLEVLNLVEYFRDQMKSHSVDILVMIHYNYYLMCKLLIFYQIKSLAELYPIT